MTVHLKDSLQTPRGVQKPISVRGPRGGPYVSLCRVRGQPKDPLGTSYRGMVNRNMPMKHRSLQTTRLARGLAVKHFAFFELLPHLLDHSFKRRVQTYRLGLYLVDDRQSFIESPTWATDTIYVPLSPSTVPRAQPPVVGSSRWKDREVSAKIRPTTLSGG